MHSPSASQADQIGVASWSQEAEFLNKIIETQKDVAAVELDAPTIMQLVAERTQKLTGADGASVQTVEGDELVFQSVSGVMKPHLGTRLKILSSLAGRAITTGEHQYCQDATTDTRIDREATTRLGIGSFVVVPLCLSGHAAGLLSVSSTRADAFSPQTIAALRLMAGVVTAALSHALELQIKKKLLVERTAAMAALRESEERFRSSFEYAAIGMALVGLDGRWIQVNRSLCASIGYTESELLVSDFQSITHPADLDADMASVRKLIAGEIRDYQMTKRYFHKQGQIVWALLSVSLVRDGNGKPLYFISQIQDITRRKQAEDALRASENEFRTTFEMAGVGKAQADLETARFSRVNAKLCQITGYSSDELLALTFRDLTHPDDIQQTVAIVQQLRDGEVDDITFEKRYVRKDGRIIWVNVNAAAIRDSNGKPQRAVATIKDITAGKRAEWLEQDRRKVLEMVAKDMPLPEVHANLALAVERQIHNSTAAVLVLQDGTVRLDGPNLQPQWREALQAASLSMTANLARGVWDGTETVSVTFPRTDDVWTNLRPLAQLMGIEACWAVAIAATDQSPLGLLVVFLRSQRGPDREESQTLDMAAKLATICIEHHNTTRQLAHLVRHDNLTGLPNRLMFDDRLQQAMALSRRSGKQTALLVLDIDKFKSINDTYGHHAGDHLLQQFAQRLRNKLRETDTMARVGGDEFVIVLPELEKPEDAATVATKLVECLTEPFDLGERVIKATSSIGIALFPKDADDAVSLQKQADEALYRVKERGRNGFSF